MQADEPENKQQLAFISLRCLNLAEVVKTIDDNDKSVATFFKDCDKNLKELEEEPVRIQHRRIHGLQYGNTQSPATKVWNSVITSEAPQLPQLL